MTYESQPESDHLTDSKSYGVLTADSDNLPVKYPAQYVSTFQANDGSRFTVRPIRAEDEPLLAAFHSELSDLTIYMRYFAPLKLEIRVAHERLLKRCLIDYRHEMALVALLNGESRGTRIAGVARLIKTSSGDTAELAFVVADQCQHRGLGTYLLQRTIEIARRERIVRLEAFVLADNFSMKDLFRHAGFHFSLPEGGIVTAWLQSSAIEPLPRMETARANKENLNWDAGRHETIMISRGKTKSARRLLPMMPRVRLVLELRWEAAGKAASGWVWPANTRSGHMEHDTLRVQHKKAVNESKVHPFDLLVPAHVPDTPGRIGL